MLFNPNSRTNGHTLLDPSLADKFAGEESMDFKVVGVYTTDNQPQPKMLDSYVLYCVSDMQFSPNSRANRHTLLELNLADRSAGKESIEPKVDGGCAYDGQPMMAQDVTEV